MIYHIVGPYFIHYPTTFKKLKIFCHFYINGSVRVTGEFGLALHNLLRQHNYQDLNAQHRLMSRRI